MGEKIKLNPSYFKVSLTLDIHTWKRHWKYSGISLGSFQVIYSEL